MYPSDTTPYNENVQPDVACSTHSSFFRGFDFGMNVPSFLEHRHLLLFKTVHKMASHLFLVKEKCAGCSPNTKAVVNEMAKRPHVVTLSTLHLHILKHNFTVRLTIYSFAARRAAILALPIMGT